MKARMLMADFLTPDGWLRGSMQWSEEGWIESLEGERIAEDAAGKAHWPIALPGFVDLHAHGAGGSDVMDGGNAIAQIGKTLLAHGTTAWLATTMTAPYDDISHAMESLRDTYAAIMQTVQPAQPHLLGVHLEGPYISNKKLGAQPNYTEIFDLEQVQQWHQTFPIRVLTLAPEEENLPHIAALHRMGIRVQLGHSDADYETTCRGLRAGASGFTHLFNAMSALHHRAPGMAGAALAHAEHAEIIPDLVCVHPGAILAALRSIPSLYCVSDSTSATGMPDGTYQLGRQSVNKCMGAVRLADGTLAGSTLTLDVALRNLVDLGLSIAQASARVSTIAADYLGLNQHGRLRVGAWADAVLMDASLTLKGVVVRGKTV